VADALQDYGAAGAFAEMGLFDEALDFAAGEPERRKILVVSTEPEFEPLLMEQALSLSGRMGSELVAVIVNPGTQIPQCARRGPTGNWQRSRQSTAAPSICGMGAHRHCQRPKRR
jgi:hypothetical protein